MDNALDQLRTLVSKRVRSGKPITQDYVDGLYDMVGELPLTRFIEDPENIVQFLLEPTSATGAQVGWVDLAGEIHLLIGFHDPTKKLCTWCGGAGYEESDDKQPGEEFYYKRTCSHCAGLKVEPPDCTPIFQELVRQNSGHGYLEEQNEDEREAWEQGATCMYIAATFPGYEYDEEEDQMFISYRTALQELLPDFAVEEPAQVLEEGLVLWTNS